ncbi:hypothetical protein CHUAL_006585 [Chamberlinius hualienensis]
MRLSVFIVFASFCISRGTFYEVNRRRSSKIYPPRITEWFYIKSFFNPLSVLDVEGDTPCLGSRVIYSLQDHSESQLWKWQGDMIINKGNGMALDIKNGLPGNDGLILYYPLNSPNQRWTPQGTTWYSNSVSFHSKEMPSRFLGGALGVAQMLDYLPLTGVVPPSSVFTIEHERECYKCDQEPYYGIR